MNRIVFMIAALYLVVESASRSTAQEPGSWLMYQRSPDHNAVLSGPEIGPWKFDAGARINGGLALVGTTLLLDTFANELIALDVRSGRLVWRSKADNILMSTPVVTDDLVFVGTGMSGLLAGEAGPTTYASTFLAPSTATNPIWGRPEGDQLIAYDLRTGDRRWSFRTVGQDMPSPAISGGMLVFANGDLHAYGLDTKTGTRRWMRALEGFATMASATVGFNGVYLSVCNIGPYRCETVAVEPRTGKVVWRSPLGNSDSSPTYDGQHVYVSGVINSRNVAQNDGYSYAAALNAKTGQVEWKYQTAEPGPYTEVGSSERAIAGTFANGIYYQPVPTHDLLLAFDAASGKVRWRFKSIAPIKMSPVLTRGRLYAGDMAGILYELDAKTGAVRARRPFKRPFTVSPPIVIGRMLVIANDSVVYSLPLK